MAKKFNLKSVDNNVNTNNSVNSLVLKAKIMSYMSSGLDINSAAKLVGISNQKLSILRLDPDLEEFIQNEEIKYELSNLENIKTAGDMGAWQASSWLLERRFPERYGKKDIVKHEYEFKLHAFQKTILLVINKLPNPVRQVFLQELRSLNLDEQVNNFQEEFINSLPVVSGKKD